MESLLDKYAKIRAARAAKVEANGGIMEAIDDLMAAVYELRRQQGQAREIVRENLDEMFDKLDKCVSLYARVRDHLQ